MEPNENIEIFKKETELANSILRRNRYSTVPPYKWYGPDPEPKDMEIMQLQREDIPLVTKGGNQKLIEEVTAELDEAELHNCVLYVRYGPMFLQRLRVDKTFLTHPELEAHLHDEELWEHHKPNTI